MCIKTFVVNRGDFELWRTGRSPELCDGFQAHLSCTASPKVQEVAKKFPTRVQLEELPRQDSWPIQFHENGPTYDNIAVFFFARDTHRYAPCNCFFFTCAPCNRCSYLSVAVHIASYSNPCIFLKLLHSFLQL
jgi:hypothetical protein